MLENLLPGWTGKLLALILHVIPTKARSPKVGEGDRAAGLRHPRPLPVGPLWVCHSRLDQVVMVY
jgi:hypothetical protein